MTAFALGITRVDLLRHGQTVGGEGYRGSTDDALSLTGWQQMRAAVGGAGDWSHIVSSPLKRCVDFTLELARARDIPYEIDKHLSEIHFGDWEGQTASQLMATHPEHLARFWADPMHNSPPNGEMLSEFEWRVLESWNDHTRVYSGEHLLFVTHGGPIRTIVGHLQNLSWRERFALTVPHASMTRVESRGRIAQNRAEPT